MNKMALKHMARWPLNLSGCKSQTRQRVEHGLNNQGMTWELVLAGHYVLIELASHI
jgi:hypothetical protein